MASEYLRRLEEVVVMALTLPPEARAALLDRECAGDAALRTDAELVLAHQEEKLTDEQQSGETLTQPGVLTVLLRAARKGDDTARERFWEIVFDDLRRTARGLLAKERRRDLPEGTSLVLRAGDRVGYGRSVDWKNRKYFFGAVILTMRRIIIEIIRNPKTSRELFEDLASSTGVEQTSLPALGEAIERLAVINERAADVVRFRFFFGLTAQQAADALGISKRQATNDFAFARAWLHRELESDPRVT